jgi:hypothetical protein
MKVWTDKQGNSDYNKNPANIPTFKCGGKMKHDGTGETSFLQDVEEINITETKRKNSFFIMFIFK